MRGTRLPISRLSRRELVRGSALLLAGAALAACGGPAAPTAAPAATTAAAPKPAAATTAPAAGATTAPAAGATAAPAATTAPAAAKPAAGKAVELRVHSVQKQDVSDWITKNLDQFKQLQPNITVKMEPIPGWTDAYIPKILAMAAANQIGDNLWYAPRHGSHLRLAAVKMVQPINDLAKADGFDLSKEYFAGANETNSWQGKQWWLSYISEPVQPVIAYNKDLVAKAGVQVPKDGGSYEDLTAFARQMTKGDVFGFFRGGGDSFSSSRTLRSFNAELIDADGKKSALDATPGGLQFFEWRNSLMKDKVSPAPPAPGAPSINEVFLAQKLVSTEIWPWFIQILPDQAKDKFEVGFFVAPYGPAGKLRSLLNEHVFGVAQASKNPPEAWQFLKWICGKDMCKRRVLEAQGGPVAKPDVWLDADIIKKYPTYGKVGEIMNQIEPDWKAANFRGDEITNNFTQRYSEMEVGQATPADTLKAIVNETNEILSRPMA